MELLEKGRARGFNPLAVDGGFVLSGDGPVGLEAAEVVEADDVVEELGAADAVDPPGEARLLEDVPLVEGIAPALAGLREIVGRDTGNADGQEVLVELEELGVRPDVGAVVVDEDGDVANEADVAVGAVCAEGAPLLAEGELEGLGDGEFFAVFEAEGVEGRRLAVFYVAGPVTPGGVVELAAQDGVERPVIEPGGVLAAVGFEGGPFFGCGW